MKSRRQDVSEDLRLVKPRRRYKEEPANISVNGIVISDSIPVDLILEILSRLPAKSIARFRCVYKLWASILRRPDFAELFLARSQARPQLLFTCHKQRTGKLFFFSSPQQPQYSGVRSSLATASYHMKIPLNYPYQPIWHINSLVFVRDRRILEGRKNRAIVSIVCNPSTGQALVLPKMKTRKNGRYNYMGYDPIEKQFKVLSMIAPTSVVSSQSQECQVLTLGTKKMSWRKVECCRPHFPKYIFNVICVNGVLYYEAFVSGGTTTVCFDIRSEKFRFVKANSDYPGEGAKLINYNGKLGALKGLYLHGTSSNWSLWILEDTEKHEWSRHIRVLPPMWKDVVRDIRGLDVVGMTRGNEIVFSPRTHSLPFYVVYYNFEQNTIRRVEIQGLEGSKDDIVHTFLNHVEDIKSVDGY